MSQTSTHAGWQPLRSTARIESFWSGTGCRPVFIRKGGQLAPSTFSHQEAVLVLLGLSYGNAKVRNQIT